MIKCICNLAPNFIKWSSIEKLTKDETEFRQFANFPGVIGAIGGCHINIKAHNEAQAHYMDRKFNHGINLMAICDSSRKFTFVNVGLPGSAHDRRVFQRSGFMDE